MTIRLSVAPSLEIESPNIPKGVSVPIVKSSPESTGYYGRIKGEVAFVET